MTISNATKGLVVLSAALAMGAAVFSLGRKWTVGFAVGTGVLTAIKASYDVTMQPLPVRGQNDGNQHAYDLTGSDRE